MKTLQVSLHSKTDDYLSGSKQGTIKDDQESVYRMCNVMNCCPLLVGLFACIFLSRTQIKSTINYIESSNEDLQIVVYDTEKTPAITYVDRSNHKKGTPFKQNQKSYSGKCKIEY